MILIRGEAYADASWQWISQTRPYDVLPYVAVGTIIIEALSINLIPRIYRSLKVFIVVMAGNLLSFLTPYALKALDSPNGLLQTYSQQLEHNHYFNISIIYLGITLLVELPFVFKLLQKDTDEEKKLFCTILIVNIVTTALVALIERLLCPGG
jgi:hypothetical protein